MPENGISIDLTQAQIHRVVRESADAGDVLGVLSGLRGVDVLSSSSLLTKRTLSRSLLRGLTVLASFPKDGSARSVTEVATDLGIGMSTTHRYVTTLVEAGLLERDPVTRMYQLPRQG
jgi:hypothetical protein